jgi:hypothetical protein
MANVTRKPGVARKKRPKKKQKVGTAPAPPRVAPRPEDHPRFSIVETLYHQPAGEQPTSIASRYYRWLESDKPPYNRKYKIGETWETIDLGSLTKVAHISIYNLEGQFAGINPTHEQVEEALAKVVEVAYSDSDEPEGQWIVHPGENHRGTPVDPTMLKVKCRSGEATIRVVIIPE